MEYKSTNPDEILSQTDRFNSICNKEMKSDDIEYWREKFDTVDQQISKIEKNISAIDNELKAFQLLIKEDHYPPVQFVYGDNVIFYFFKFLQEQWQSSLKLLCIGIIGRLVTYMKKPIVDLITNDMINSFMSFLTNRDLLNEQEYPTYTYNITQIFKNSCNFSSEFAVALYNSNFYSEFADLFLKEYSDKINDANTIYCTYFNIVKIFGDWLQLEDSIPDEFAVDLLSNYFQIFQLQNEILNNQICCSLLQSIEEREIIIPTLAENNFFCLAWDSIERGKITQFILEIVSYGLIIDGEIQQKIAEVVKPSLIFEESKLYLENMPSEGPNLERYQNVLESLITLICNYINYIKKWPSDLSFEEVSKLANDIFLGNDCNYHIKNCTTFLVLELFEYCETLELDKMYSMEFIELVFDTLNSANDDIIDKAIDVFEILLNRANESEFNANDSIIFNSLIPKFLNYLLELDHFSKQANILIDEFYQDKIHQDT